MAAPCWLQLRRWNQSVRKGMKNGGNVEAATIVGARIAEKAKAAGIDTVAFDRSGFRYHGRVKALAGRST